MPAKNDNITKNPIVAQKKSSQNRKGKPNKRTIIKKALEESWDKAEGIVEKNMLEFLQSKNKKIKFEATRYFGEFAKAKKREVTGKLEIGFEEWLKKELENPSGDKTTEPGTKTD